MPAKWKQEFVDEFGQDDKGNIHRYHVCRHRTNCVDADPNTNYQPFRRIAGKINGESGNYRSKRESDRRDKDCERHAKKEQKVGRIMAEALPPSDSSAQPRISQAVSDLYLGCASDAGSYVTQASQDHTRSCSPCLPATSTYPSDHGDHFQSLAHPIVEEDALMLPTSAPYFPMPFYLPSYEMDASRRDLHPRHDNRLVGQHAEHRSHHSGIASTSRSFTWASTTLPDKSSTLLNDESNVPGVGIEVDLDLDSFFSNLYDTGQTNSVDTGPIDETPIAHEGAFQHWK